MPRKTKLTKKEKAKEIKELKTVLSQEEVNSLEQMIDEENDKINPSELREFLNSKTQEVEISSSSSPSLKKINPPQKVPVRLERDMITGAMSIENLSNGLKEEENGDSLKYNKIDDKKKQEYQPIIQEYQEIQKEFMKQNPNILIKQQSFIDPSKINLADSFPRKNFNIMVNGSLKGPMDVNKDYVFKSSFVEKEKVFSRNPFDKKEAKYDPFKQ